jgi:nitroreductase
MANPPVEPSVSVLADAVERRFGDRPSLPAEVHGAATLARMLDRSSQRRFRKEPVDDRLVELLCAAALSAPSKSDSQQADIVIVQDPAKRARIAELLPDNAWIPTAPIFMIFCGNNFRQREIARLRAKPFPNDHLDPFFNAAVDTGIVLSAFILAAEAVGLGCCPVSVIRNHAQEVSTMLALPDYVFPVAGLGIGWPDGKTPLSPRLPLAVTVHRDRHDTAAFERELPRYDARRIELRPYGSQRDPARFGTVDAYGWSEDKARQYATPERADFGAYVRSRKFKLD